MAVTLTITNASNNVIAPDTQNQFISELVSVTGSSSAAADTGTYTTMIPRPIGIKGGALSATFSGQAATITANAALGSRTVYAEIFGRG